MKEENFFDKCKTCQHCYTKKDDDYVYCRKRNGKCEYKPYRSKKQRRMSMTESEAKAIKWLKNVRDDAVVTLDHIQKDEPNVSPMLYTGRKRKAETIMEMCEELQQYRAIGTIEEFKDLKEYKAKMEMQYLDDINNPLEPLKLSSALQSEIFKYNYRKEHKPQDISPLDYTIMYALKHCLEEQTEETKET